MSINTSGYENVNNQQNKRTVLGSVSVTKDFFTYQYITTGRPSFICDTNILHVIYIVNQDSCRFQLRKFEDLFKTF